MNKILTGIGIIIVVGAIVFYLWNNIMIDAIGAGKITYPQACGMFILSNFLSKSNKNGD